jgi:hypothetical protein
MLNDPVFPQLVAYFQTGGVLSVNVNAAAFDALCVAVTGFDGAHLPSGETALVHVHNMMQTYTTNAADMYDEMNGMVPMLAPSDSTITIERIESDCVEVLLADFTVTYLTPWLARTTPTVDTTLRADIQAFWQAQTDNLAAYRSKNQAALQALQAMSHASNPSMAGMMPSMLQGLIGQIAGFAMNFGQIGKTPGQEYKDSQSQGQQSDSSSPSSGSTPSGDSNQGSNSPAPVDYSQPVQEAGSVNSGSAAPTQVG